MFPLFAFGRHRGIGGRAPTRTETVRSLDGHGPSEAGAGACNSFSAISYSTVACSTQSSPFPRSTWSPDSSWRGAASETTTVQRSDE